jgi:hypothetical protein
VCHDGLYHLLKAAFLLEKRCPGGNISKCSQSSFSPFISDEIQTDPKMIKRRSKNYNKVNLIFLNFITIIL